MPLPLIPIFVGVAAGVIIAIVFFFLGSARGKARAADFKVKVVRIAEVLKARIEALEKAYEAAAAARDAASARAREAEAASTASSEEAARARAAATRERERAERAEEALRACEERLAAIRDELSRWEAEIEAATGLEHIAGSAITVANVRTLRTIVSGSLVLSAHKLNPEAALAELDAIAVAAEDGRRTEEEFIRGMVDAIGEVADN